MLKRINTGSVLYIEEKTEFDGSVSRYIVRARADANGFAVPTNKVKERYRINTYEEMVSLREALDAFIEREEEPLPRRPTPSMFTLDDDVEERMKVR